MGKNNRYNGSYRSNKGISTFLWVLISVPLAGYGIYGIYKWFPRIISDEWANGIVGTLFGIVFCIPLLWPVIKRLKREKISTDNSVPDFSTTSRKTTMPKEEQLSKPQNVNVEPTSSLSPAPVPLSSLKTDNVLDSFKEKKEDGLIVYKHTFKIHPEIMPLLWIGDGEMANYEIPKHRYKTVAISSSSEIEPSAIFTELPIRKPNRPDIDPGPDYYPKYSDITREQRWIYLKFLEDPFTPINIGYVFILYYGLERHLLMGNYESAHKVVLKLQKVHENKSFQHYSSNALTASALLHNDVDALKELARNPFIEDLNLLLFLHYAGDVPVSPNILIKFAKEFGMTNNRYIKAFPKMFFNVLSDLLEEKYKIPGLDLHQMTNNAEIENLPRAFIGIFANFSLPPKVREGTIPAFTKVPGLLDTILSLLKETHEKIKKIPMNQRY